MKKLLYSLFLVTFFTGCVLEKDSDIDTPVDPLLGKWYNVYSSYSNDTHTHFKRTHVAEFGDSSFSLVYREKTVTLPDCTLISQNERITLAHYKLDWKFLRLTDMQSEVNGVSEYHGKQTYMYIYQDPHEININKAEVWKQLAGNPGQLKDGLFYYRDSTSGNIKHYIHFKLNFTGQDSIQLKYSESDFPEMPSDNANWIVSKYSSPITDSTFSCDYEAIYKFYNDILVTYKVTGYHEIYQGYR